MTVLLVCGGTNYMDQHYVYERLDAYHREKRITTLVEGGAPGADTWARMWALAHPDIILATVNADWNGPCRETCAPNHRIPYSGLASTYCPAAGPYRNQDMLEVHQPDEVLAFPGEKGTASMVRLAIPAGVPVIQTARS